ncbi:MAG: hypothetical protein GY749_39150 [Desulfobacteraceae bacterium]|nr:hypothetical protein [Desulfobacteraceae bacterium]
MAVCKFCNKEMLGASSCIDSHVVIEDKKYSPVPYEKPSTVFQKQSRCPECNIMPGGFHHVGCGLEICPLCKGHWVSCRCSGIKIKIDECSDGKCKIIPFKTRN